MPVYHVFKFELLATEYEVNVTLVLQQDLTGPKAARISKLRFTGLAKSKNVVQRD